MNKSELSRREFLTGGSIMALALLAGCEPTTAEGWIQKELNEAPEGPVAKALFEYKGGLLRENYREFVIEVYTLKYLDTSEVEKIKEVRARISAITKARDVILEGFRKDGSFLKEYKGERKDDLKHIIDTAQAKYGNENALSHISFDIGYSYSESSDTPVPSFGKVHFGLVD